VGDIDAWTFTANAGDAIVVRAGEVTPGSTLLPWLRLYGPNGVLLSQDFNAAGAEVTTRATNSGTFLVVMADGNSGWTGSGNYRINLAKTGSPLVISPSDEGGPLTNGSTYLGAIEVGDIDAWTFTANAGETMVVRAGETVSSTLTPWLRLYGPNGVLLTSDFNAAAAEVTVQATNSGTFTVVMADGTSGWTGSGNYRVSLAKTGQPLVISAGDEGGSMTGAGSYDGMIDVGDIDAWTFTAFAGDLLSINVTELVPASPLSPWLRLYGRNGAQLVNTFGAATAQFTNFVAPTNGTYLVVVADGTGGIGGSGTYRMTVNNLSDGLKLRQLPLSGTNLNVIGIGGSPGSSGTLLTTLNITNSLALWAPVTNQFDQFGAFTFTNFFNPAEHQRFFLLRTP